MQMIPKNELLHRLSQFREQMNSTNPDWEMVVILSKINLYYFTGTMQDGMLLIPRDDEAVFWVQRSYEGALAESSFTPIKPMQSFRDAAAGTKNLPSVVYLETSTTPLALFQRFKKHFPITDVRSVDRQIAQVRAIKSKYELSLLIQSGQIHRRVLEEMVPNMLKEGMSEAESYSTTSHVIFHNFYIFRYQVLICTDVVFTQCFLPFNTIIPQNKKDFSIFIG